MFYPNQCKMQCVIKGLHCLEKFVPFPEQMDSCSVFQA